MNNSNSLSQSSIDLAQVRRIFGSGKSLSRSFMNARVEKLTLQSPILDLGAGEVGSASYHNVIPNFRTNDVQSVDIVPDNRPTKVADVEEHIPFDDNSFQTCLAFNLFEHLYRPDDALCEIYRVLAPRGKLYLVVPFLMRVHADPSDYYRYTRYTLENKLNEQGFLDCQIEPLGHGAMTAGLAQVDFAVPRLLRGLALRLALLLDGYITRRSSGKYRNAHDYPLSYFVIATKGN